MTYLDLMDHTAVEDIDDLIEYTRSRFGVVVDWREKVKFRTMLKEFVKDNPHVEISVLAKAVDWGKSSGKKVRALSGIFFMASQAFAAGALPELDPTYARRSSLDDQVLEALAVEECDEWRARLIASSGPARERALAEWHRHRLAAV